MKKTLIGALVVLAAGLLGIPWLAHFQGETERSLVGDHVAAADEEASWDDDDGFTLVVAWFVSQEQDAKLETRANHQLRSSISRYRDEALRDRTLYDVQVGEDLVNLVFVDRPVGNHREARQLGRAYHADLVLWGDVHREEPPAVDVTVRTGDIHAEDEAKVVIAPVDLGRAYHIQASATLNHSKLELRHTDSINVSALTEYRFPLISVGSAAAGDAASERGKVGALLAIAIGLHLVEHDDPWLASRFFAAANQDLVASTASDEGMAYLHAAMAFSFLEQPNFAEAVRSADLVLKTSGDRRIRAMALHVRALAEVGLAEYDSAKLSLLALIALASELGPERTLTLAHAFTGAAEVARATGDCEGSRVAALEAQGLARHAIERMSQYGPEDALLAAIQVDIALADLCLGDHGAARSQLASSLVVMARVHGERSAQAVLVMSNLALVDLAMDRPELALETLRLAWDLASKQMGLQHPVSLTIGYDIALALLALDRDVEARASLELVVSNAKENGYARLGETSEVLLAELSRQEDLHDLPGRALPLPLSASGYMWQRKRLERDQYEENERSRRIESGESAELVEGISLAVATVLTRDACDPLPELTPCEPGSAHLHDAEGKSRAICYVSTGAYVELDLPAEDAPSLVGILHEHGFEGPFIGQWGDCGAFVWSDLAGAAMGREEIPYFYIDFDPRIPDQAEKIVPSTGTRAPVKMATVGHEKSPFDAAELPDRTLDAYRAAVGTSSPEGRGECLIAQVVAEAVEKAGRPMHRSLGRSVIAISCRRDTTEQALWHDMLCGSEEACTRAARPGESYHALGVAIDVRNWMEAGPFLERAGFAGGCEGVEDGRMHFTFGGLDGSRETCMFWCDDCGVDE